MSRSIWRGGWRLPGGCGATRASADLTDSARHRRLLVFPEAVVLAELFCDLDWRRHIAMLEHEYDPGMSNFARAVSRRLGQPPLFALHLCYSSTDPLHGWIRRHRHAYTDIRNQFYKDLRRSYYRSRPLPEIRHFT